MAGDEDLTFAALLKRHRRLIDLTQEELAERAGYSSAYISALERGVRSPLGTTAELLANSLDLEPEDRARLLAAASRMAARRPVHSTAQPVVAPKRGGPALASWSGSSGIYPDKGRECSF
jgi:transcriptional regulator with XRE-family HTH domain